jgi:hypothetical protein
MVDPGNVSSRALTYPHLVSIRLGEAGIKRSAVPVLRNRAYIIAGCALAAWALLLCVGWLVAQLFGLL